MVFETVPYLEGVFGAEIQSSNENKKPTFWGRLQFS